MNKSRVIVSRALVAALLFGVYGATAQTEKKTYSETFKVNENTVITINTSHADIEFDSWNKNQVVVEAVIELEGATEEEAQRYFEENGIKILGNSQEIEISTQNSHSWGPYISGIPGVDRDIVIDVPEIAPFFAEIEIPDLPALPEMAELPPMPPIPPIPPMDFGEFDYEEYQERGEAYLKEWSEKFRENLDEDWAKNMEDWGKQYQSNMEEYRKLREEYKKEREELRKEQIKEREEMRKEQIEEREEMRQEAEELRKEALKEAQKMREEERRNIHRNVIISSERTHAPKVYYYSQDGRSGKYKVKRSIRIKMPKSVKLKMNVRHGEVKLAETTLDIKASLSYASLLATTIDGAETDIAVAYTPVKVENWNLGKLNTKYSGQIALVDVDRLVLDATSSEVTITRLLHEAEINNNLGSLVIQSVAPEFKRMEVGLKNGQLNAALPKSAFKIRATGTHSSFAFPGGLTLQETKDHSGRTYQGYYLNETGSRSIVINSSFSEVSLTQ